MTVVRYVQDRISDVTNPQQSSIGYIVLTRYHIRGHFGSL